MCRQMCLCSYYDRGGGGRFVIHWAPEWFLHHFVTLSHLVSVAHALYIQTNNSSVCKEIMLKD